MKFFETCTTFAHAWFDVAAGLFKRYPNPYSKHVLSEDVLERYIEDGKLHTVKLVTKTNPLPKWAEKFYRGPKFIAVIEESIVDGDAHTFITYTRNISGNSLMSCTERCVFKLDSTDNQKTVIEKQAWLDTSMGFGLKRPVLEFALKRYAKNQHKATLGLEHIITNTEPLNLRTIVEQSKLKLSEKAKHSKEILSQKAKMASELAKSKTDISKVKVHASEAD